MKLENRWILFRKIKPVKMARLVALLILTVCLVQQVFSIDKKVNREACIRDSSVNPSLVEKANNGDISDNRSLKCYYKCYYENAGYMDSTGNIKVDKLKSGIPAGADSTRAKAAIDLCKDKKGKDACETAYLTQKCLLTNNVKL